MFCRDSPKYGPISDDCRSTADTKVLNEARLAYENAASERRFDLLLSVAELGRANRIVTGTCRCCTRSAEWLGVCGIPSYGKWRERGCPGTPDMTMNTNGGEMAIGDKPE